MPIGYAQHESFHWPVAKSCLNTTADYNGGVAMFERAARRSIIALFGIVLLRVAWAAPGSGAAPSDAPFDIARAAHKAPDEATLDLLIEEGGDVDIVMFY
jgi:hypothetical protein